MGELARIKSELTLPSTAEYSLANRSEALLPSGMGLVLATMMDEVQAAFPNQVLLPDTVKMYLSQWEDLAVKYGLEEFRAALLRAIRSAEFVPSPKQIEDWCESLRRDRIDRKNAVRVIAELDALKAQCERERLEDEADGPREKSETEKRLDAILAAARRDKRRA